MNKVSFAALTCALALACDGDGSRPQPADFVAFEHVNVITMIREEILADQTVLIEKETIAAIGPAAEVAVPDGARRIAGDGAYLLPGLADLHVHLCSADELVSYLAHGVTTILNMRGAPVHLQWKDAIIQDAILGPNLYTAGPTTDGYPPTTGRNVALDSAEAAREEVRRQKAAGYDVIKVYNRYAPEVFEALLEAARDEGMSVVGHIPREVGPKRALALGQAMVAHGEEFYHSYFSGPDDFPDAAKISEIGAMARLTKESGAYVAPDLISVPYMILFAEGGDAIFSDEEMKYLPPVVFHRWKPSNNGYANRPNLDRFIERNRLMYAFLKRFSRALHEAGVPLLVGTDSTVVGFPGQSTRLEVDELVLAGLTPYEALDAATRTAGRFVAEHIDAEERFGTVSVGRRADLILVADNPLEGVEHLREILGVMVRGRWLPKDELDADREALVKDYPAMKELVDALDEHILAGRLDDAVETFRDARNRFPGTALFAGSVLRSQGYRRLEEDPQGALRIFELAAELYPHRFWIYNALAEAQMKIGDKEKARRSLEKALELSPNDAVARRGLAELARAAPATR